jgi:putative FmdB family regulatory protein
MPTYKYICPNCKEVFHVKKEMKNASTEERCDCGAVATKQIESPIVKYMGTGWTRRTFARNLLDDQKKKNSKIKDSYI